MLYAGTDRAVFPCAVMVSFGSNKKGKHICTSHQIRNSVIEELLVSGIREITGYVRENEAEFVEMIAKKSKAETTEDFVRQSVNLISSRQESVSRMTSSKSFMRKP